MTQINNLKTVNRVNSKTCDQCGKCLSTCSITARVEGFNPAILWKVALGREADLMKSDVIWTCTSHSSAPRNSRG